MTKKTRDDTAPHPAPRRGGSMFGSMRTSFLTGLVVILPIGLTIWLVWSLAGWIDGVVLPLIPGPYRPDRILDTFLGWEDTPINIRGVGVVVFLLFTIFVGWLAKGLIGRSLLRWAEQLVDRMPVVRSVYNGLKQIAETVFAQTDTSFEKACLVEYPRKGIWAIAFISTAAKGEIVRQIDGHDELMSVFLPTTPNPTSGFLLFVPKKDVLELQMSVEDAAKLVISAGLVYPNPKNPVEPPAAPPARAAE